MTFAIRVERVSSDAADIAIGETGAGRMPDEFVVVDGADAPFMRIGVYHPADEYHLRTEALAWAGWIAVGFAGRVVLISIDDRSQRTIALSDSQPPVLADYFCQLYACSDCLLVGSGRKLFRVDMDGSVGWTSGELGLDGVLVHSVDDGIVSGSGEWDPPGGWRPFAISLKDGSAV
jgi:hypothetical protein